MAVEWFRVIIRFSKKLKKSWIVKHEKDGLDEWRIAAFIKSQYILGSYTRLEANLILFKLRFQKRGGQLMKASLWVREKEINGGMVELVVFRGHAEPLESK